MVDSSVNFDDVLNEVHLRAASGELSQTIANGKIRYQASDSHPVELIRRINPDTHR